ncbi:MAG: hypothetical protein ACT4N2_08235 [Hyphomicrobium sp.]
MLRLIRLAAVIGLALIMAAPAQARAPEWVELGDHTVKLFETDDEIKVGRDDGVFTKIRFEVYGNDIDIRDMRVRFLNGEEQVIRIDRKIRQNTVSPEFDLPGRRRGIASIFLRYNGRSIFGGKPRIKVFAERSDFDRAPPPPPPPPPVAGAGRPAILDTQAVRNETDRIVFNVGRDEGRITQIRLRAVNESLLYRSMEITFANGQTQVVDGIERLEPGEQGKAVDLSGESRVIEKVVVYKRPSWRSGESKVELLGLVVPRPAPPVAGGFELLDTADVDRRSDRVVLRVPNGSGPHTKIKFKALDDSILFRNIQIVFGNGESQNIEVVERLAVGEESPDLDIDGNRRNIVQVIVTKRPSWSAGSSRLQLYGLEPPRAPPPPPRPSGPSHGYPGGWVFIGDRDLAATPPAPPPFRPSIGRYEIPNYQAPRVPAPTATEQIRIGGRDVGQFRSIGLRLLGEDVELVSATVVYGNGERDQKALNTTLGNRERTRPIDLRGDRFIREIEVEYRKATGGRSRIEVYGDYADNWLGERGKRRDFNQGWVMLGSQPAAMFSSDVDAFYVGDRYGGFRSVKFTVRRHDVRFYGMRIVYGNGQVEEVPFSGELSDGQSTPPLDLKGRQRTIERIEVKYRTKLNFRGDGVVEVWGLQ